MQYSTNFPRLNCFQMPLAFEHFQPDLLHFCVLRFLIGLLSTSVSCLNHEPERTGSLKIRKVWLLGSDVMGLQVSRHRI